MFSIILSMGFGCGYLFFRTIRLEKVCPKLLNTKVFPSQPAITCSKLAIEALEQGVKYVES